MTIRFERKFEVAGGRAVVNEFLTEPRHLATLLPGVESIQAMNQSIFAAKARVGISHKRGGVSLKFEILEKR